MGDPEVCGRRDTHGWSSVMESPGSWLAGTPSLGLSPFLPSRMLSVSEFPFSHLWRCWVMRLCLFLAFCRCPSEMSSSAGFLCGNPCVWTCLCLFLFCANCDLLIKRAFLSFWVFSSLESGLFWMCFSMKKSSMIKIFVIKYFCVGEIHKKD